MSFRNQISRTLVATSPTRPRSLLPGAASVSPLRALLLLALGSLVALCPVAARGQVFTTAPMPGFSTSTPNGRRAADPAVRQMMRHMAAERNTERQKKIVSDTAHLFELAKQLKAEVADTTKNTLSVSVVKKAEEIEKLAKSIKDKMRNGN